MVLLHELNNGFTPSFRLQKLEINSSMDKFDFSYSKNKCLIISKYAPVLHIYESRIMKWARLYSLLNVMHKNKQKYIGNNDDDSNSENDCFT